VEQVSGLYCEAIARSPTMGHVSTLYCGQVCAIYSRQVSALNREANVGTLLCAMVRSLLWGNCLRSTVGQVSMFNCGASVRALLSCKCPHSTVVQVSELYCGASVCALL
jgi:hypothetical protein